MEPALSDDLNPDEARAVASLKGLVKRWPRSLALFAASGSLVVARPGEIDGLVCRSRVIEIPGIHADGGDPEWCEGCDQCT